MTIYKTQEKVGKSLEDIGRGENVLNRTPMAYALRSRIDKWEKTTFLDLKSPYDVEFHFLEQDLYMRISIM